MFVKANELNGYSLLSRDGQIGKVRDFYFDDRYWAIRYLVADTGTWLSGRRVLLSPYSLMVVDKQEKQIGVDLSKQKIEGSPSLETDVPVSKQFEERFYGYYGWPVYWGGLHAWGDYPALIRDPEKRRATNKGGKEWNPHLRSTDEVKNYHVQGLDGEVGHVEDFIIDDETWSIVYLIVDTKNWLPGRKVLISPKWIDHISWDGSKVVVKLLRDAILSSPEYLEKDLLTRDYEKKLHGHYNQAGYWIANSTVILPGI